MLKEPQTSYSTQNTTKMKSLHMNSTKENQHFDAIRGQSAYVQAVEISLSMKSNDIAYIYGLYKL